MGIVCMRNFATLYIANGENPRRKKMPRVYVTFKEIDLRTAFVSFCYNYKPITNLLTSTCLHRFDKFIIFPATDFKGRYPVESG